MDEELLRIVNLPQMVDRAVATAELAPLFKESRLSATQIVDQIIPKLPDMILLAKEAVTALQKTIAELASAVEQRHDQLEKLGDSPKQRSLVIPIAAVLWAVAVGLWFAYKNLKWRAYVASLWPVFGIVGLLALGSMLFARWSWRRKLYNYNTAYERLTDDPRIADLEKRRDRLQAELRRILYDKAVRGEVNGILSYATAPSYRITLGEFTASGLSEIFVSAHEVETQAKRDLNELLKLSGGGIGLAGPRGAGKTTLMTLIANRPAREGKSACSILCPAPVEYTGRDFLGPLYA